MKFLFEMASSLRIGMRAMVANKVRGLLTTLGIIIGIVAVITTMTAANGLGNSFKESISALGSDVLYVSKMPWVMNRSFFEFRNRQSLTLKDAQLLDERLEDAVAINPTTHTSQVLKFGSKTLDNIDIIGTTDKHIVISASLPEYGRFLTANDVVYRKRVCVVGSEIKERLFRGADPINKKLKIGRYHFLVVGVMEKQGSASFFGGPNFDSQVYVPITSFMKQFGGRNRDFDIAIKAPADQALADYEYAVIGEMRKIRKLKPTEKDDFSINQMDSLVGMYNNVMGTVVLIGILLTGISLFVGGIGVMNIMFVSVTERTREIGIRKAIGAGRRAIMAQFLFESSTICMIGGVIGLAISYGITALINQHLLPADISPAIVVVALLISVMTGVLSGIIPAYKASKLNPIEALRFE